MGDENPIRTLGDYSKPSQEGYRNTIELLVRNNVVPLRSDTIRLVQNGCSIHGLRSEDPNQHLKDFLKLVELLKLDGSITTWEDLTTRFLVQFFPSGRTAKLRNDILMFQQHHGESLFEAWTYFNDLLQKVPHHGIDLWLQDLHLNLPVLEFLAHAPIYNAILDKYVESLELGKNGSAFVQGEIPAKMEDPRLFTLHCRLGDTKPFDTLADLGSCVNIIPLYLFKKLNIRLLEETDHIFGLANRTKSYPVGIVKNVEVHIGKLKLLNDFYVIDMKKDPETPLLVGRGFLATANVVIDCRMAKIVVGEGITMSVFEVKGVDLGEEEAPYWTTLGKRESYKPRPLSDGTGARTPYYARKDFLDCHLLREWEIARDAELNPFKDTLVFRRMDKPPKNGDGAWHAKIRLIDPDREEFTKTLQSIPTTRKLSERESPREIIDLDNFYDMLYLMRRSLEVLRKFHWTILG
ncbi:MAK10-like protein [Tanacetum coccineum]